MKKASKNVVEQPSRPLRSAIPVSVIPNVILRLPAVIEATGLPETRVYELMNKGEFPRNVSLGGRSVGWSSREVSDWIESLLATRA